MSPASTVAAFPGGVLLQPVIARGAATSAPRSAIVVRRRRVSMGGEPTASPRVAHPPTCNYPDVFLGDAGRAGRLYEARCQRVAVELVLQRCDGGAVDVGGKFGPTSAGREPQLHAAAPEAETQV